MSIWKELGEPMSKCKRLGGLMLAECTREIKTRLPYIPRITKVPNLTTKLIRHCN